MKKYNETSANSLVENEREDNVFPSQMRIVFEAFKRKPNTMLMVSKARGILFVLPNKRLCTIGRVFVQFLTTDPAKVPPRPPDPQMKFNFD